MNVPAFLTAQSVSVTEQVNSERMFCKCWLLRIKNLAVIEEASIPFGEGLNIVTGRQGLESPLSPKRCTLSRAMRQSYLIPQAYAEVEALLDCPPDHRQDARLRALEWFDEDHTNGTVGADSPGIIGLGEWARLC